MKAKWMIRMSFVSVHLLPLLIACVLGVFGCSASPKVQPALGSASRISEVETRTWREAVQAFNSGQYDRAVALFEVLNESARDPEMSRKGLFGLAASRLMTARTQAEFDEAMVLLDCWDEEAPEEMAGEDPRMLIPFLDRVPLFTPSEASRPKERRMERDSVHGSLTACRNNLQAREKDLEKLKSRLDSRDREIRKLRGQLESLEAIHRKFQEKKQEVSTQ